MLVTFVWKGKVYEAFDIEDPKIRQKLQSLGIDLIPIVKKEIKRRLLQKAKERINKVLDDFGYYSIGDVIYYMQKGDKEADLLKQLYDSYDNQIWDFIDKILSKYKTVEELLIVAKDIDSIERKAFEKTMQKYEELKASEGNK